MGLKERQDSIIEQLYRADDLQCKSCGVRFSKEEMPQYTSHLDWHFRIKRREKDNAKRAQSRKWYFEKADWIVSDEIEDEAEETTEEEEKEEEIVISTVAVGDSDLKNLTCPVCGDEFGQFYKQSGEGEEEGWYLHNAMKAEDGTIYHPECYKDRAQALDTSADADTTVDNETTIETPALETTEEVVTKQEPTEEEEENKPSEAVINPPSEASGVIEEESIKKEESEAQDDQCNNGEANEDSIMDPPKDTSPEPMEESEVKTEE